MTSAASGDRSLQAMTVGVLFTNFFSWELTRFSVEEVLKKCSRISEVVIVDDASDAPPLWAGSGPVAIYRNDSNTGYVRSVNRGMSLMTSEIVLLLDCDAYPLTDFTPVLMRRFSGDGRLAALGGTVVNHNAEQGLTGETVPRLFNFVVGQALDSRLRGCSPMSPDRLVLHSYCIALRAATFRAVGGFDEEFDFLDADIDLSMRLKSAGWKVAIAPTLMCRHSGSGSPQSTFARVKRFHRNRLRLLEKHHAFRWKSAVLVLLAFRHLFEWLILFVVSVASAKSPTYLEKRAGRVELLRSVFRGYA